MERGLGFDGGLRVSVPTFSNVRNWPKAALVIASFSETSFIYELIQSFLRIRTVLFILSVLPSHHLARATLEPRRLG